MKTPTVDAMDNHGYASKLCGPATKDTCFRRMGMNNIYSIALKVAEKFKESFKVVERGDLTFQSRD